jgi:hypothetical protein
VASEPRAGGVTVPPAVAERSEAIVVRWVEAFNAQDVEGMLACVAEHVEFRPLRLSGLRGCYRGHEGMREWCARLKRSRQDHAIVISETRDLGEGRVLVSGVLRLDSGAEIGSFCAVNRIDDDDLIVVAHHFLSDPLMIELLGLIP